ncbi:MAG: PspC domain-containing protein [Brooklawnia sp.]|uniref:PspC domain-containing protein n=1 Tax=Brooklawnia sp. TaxID=2699740 RepID=UPI003C771E0F
MTNRQLVRSRDHRVIAGVCGGLGEFFEIDANIVRVVAVITSMFSAGLVIGAYLVAWLIIPEQGSGQTGADQFYDRYGDYKRRREARGAGQPDTPPADTFRADEQ